MLQHTQDLLNNTSTAEFKVPSSADGNGHAPNGGNGQLSTESASKPSKPELDQNVPVAKAYLTQIRNTAELLRGEAEMLGAGITTRLVELLADLECDDPVHITTINSVWNQVGCADRKVLSLTRVFDRIVEITDAAIRVRDAA
jgi:hypothetical protein